MAILHKESDYTMSLSQREILQLEDRLTRDESRMDIINDLLMERNLLDHSAETDELIQEWHNLNSRVEQSKNRLAQLKSPNELIEEEKDRLPRQWHPDERNNIKY